ncbi:hypothetical protein NDK43_25885 [Neobacillus pocheonensis]|uniref:Uncharacterized protein n=1 Tax=Neobacillus pocheonensis TaxID=363869 RepID=A0ABT0WGJ7_9BACI|nr:hypothetical protein [Neobacillus pocheonensis]
MNTKEAYKHFEKLNYILNEMEDRYGNMPEEIECNYDEPEDQYKARMAQDILDKLRDAKRQLEWIFSPILAEGFLVKRTDGRYEIAGTDFYFTS